MIVVSSTSLQVWPAWADMTIQVQGERLLLTIIQALIKMIMMALQILFIFAPFLNIFQFPSAALLNTITKPLPSPAYLTINCRDLHFT